MGEKAAYPLKNVQNPLQIAFFLNFPIAEDQNI